MGDCEAEGLARKQNERPQKRSCFHSNMRLLGEARIALDQGFSTQIGGL